MPLILPSPIIPDLIDVIAVQWAGAKFGDTFVPVISGSLVDHSVQVEGVFGTGTNVQIQGSNDATTTTNGNYHPLTDPFSNIINMGSAQIRQTTEVTVWIKPVITAGDGNENLIVTVCIRRSYR